MPREIGTVRWFNNRKGYGFIKLVTTGEDVFVHYRNIRPNGGYRTLQEGQRVEFSLVTGQKGLQAEDVAVVE